MALTRKNPEVIQANLKLQRGQETESMKVDYAYMKTSEFNALLEEIGNRVSGAGGTLMDSLIQIVLGVVKAFPDEEYPLTEEGLRELQDERPGMLEILIGGFHEARGVQRAKN